MPETEQIVKPNWSRWPEQLRLMAKLFDKMDACSLFNDLPQSYEVQAGLRKFAKEIEAHNALQNNQTSSLH